MFKSSCLVWITCTSMRHYHVAQKYVVHCIVASCLVSSRFLWHFWVSASRSSECFLKAVPNMNKTNANSAIIILINHWSVRIVRVVQLVSVVQVVQVSRWSAFMTCIQKMVLFVVCHYLLFVVCHCLSFFVIVCGLSLFVVCRCLSLIVVVCHLSLFVVCRCLSFVTFCHCSLFVLCCCLSFVVVLWSQTRPWHFSRLALSPWEGLPDPHSGIGEKSFWHLHLDDDHWLVRPKGY